MSLAPLAEIWLILFLLLFSAAACNNPTEEKDADISSKNAEMGITSSISDNAAEAGEFDFESRTVTLNSGYEMPINGLGTYSLHGDECVDSVKAALSSGVRLIDTASAYGNEEEVGQRNGKS